MPVTNSCTNKQLRKLVLLLQELKLEDYAPRETWTINRLVQPWAGFIDEVRLIPENGDLRIELKGELAGILSLCDAKKRPATSYEERAEQIKVVAGVGFEPTTFRL